MNPVNFHIFKLIYIVEWICLLTFSVFVLFQLKEQMPNELLYLIYDFIHQGSQVLSENYNLEKIINNLRTLLTINVLYFLNYP